MKEIPYNLLDTKISERVHIKPNELRLGNFTYTNTKGKMCGNCFRAVQVKNWAKQYVDSLEPIPITNEWLDFLGLARFLGRSNETWYELANGWLRPRVDGWWAYEVGDNCEVWIEVKYIHQLQNLYFVFVGKELMP